VCDPILSPLELPQHTPFVGPHIYPVPTLDIGPTGVYATDRHLDRFSRFCTAHFCAQHTDRVGACDICRL